LVVFSDNGHNPECDNANGRYPQGVRVEGSQNITTKQPGNRMTQSTARTPVKPQIVKKAKAITSIHRVGHSKRNNSSDPDDGLQVLSKKRIYDFQIHSRYMYFKDRKIEMVIQY
jgi:hypothetical protein